MNLKMDSRFKGIEPFKDKVWLSSPTMHGEELEYIKGTRAYRHLLDKKVKKAFEK